MRRTVWSFFPGLDIAFSPSSCDQIKWPLFLICSGMYAPYFSCLNTSVNFSTYVPHIYAPCFGSLGTAVDFLRFVPRIYASYFGNLGTAMDFLRFVPRIYASYFGNLGTAVNFLRFVPLCHSDIWRTIIWNLSPVPKCLTGTNFNGVHWRLFCPLYLNPSQLTYFYGVHWRLFCQLYLSPSQCHISLDFISD